MPLRVSIIVAILVALSRPAAAAVPPGSEIRVGATFDLASIANTISTRYAVTVRHAVTADIDRDGDLDVLTASDIGFDVWLNDGTGRLTVSQPPVQPSPNASAPPDALRDSGARPDPSAPAPVPSFTGSATRSHAPPAPESLLRGCTTSRDHHAVFGVRVPRAPPAFARSN